MLTWGKVKPSQFLDVSWRHMVDHIAIDNIHMWQLTTYMLTDLAMDNVQ